MDLHPHDRKILLGCGKAARLFEKLSFLGVSDRSDQVFEFIGILNRATGTTGFKLTQATRSGRDRSFCLVLSHSLPPHWFYSPFTVRFFCFSVCNWRSLSFN